MEALNYKNVPKTFRRFVADSHIRFKYTAEFENPKYSLNFLNINITNNTANKKYKFKVHRKDTITNIHIKPNSYINPQPKVFLKVSYIMPIQFIQEHTSRKKHSF